MKPAPISLDQTSRFHLNAAEGWAGLGDWKSAKEELAQIPDTLQEHPEVLLARCRILHAAQDWEPLVTVTEALLSRYPELDFVWIDRSYALHELKRTQAAFDALLPAAERFPGHPLIRYNLACYCSQLGRLDAALDWLRTAIQLADKKEIKAMALEDPDLQPLQALIQKL